LTIKVYRSQRAGAGRVLTNSVAEFRKNTLPVSPAVITFVAVTISGLSSVVSHTGAATVPLFVKIFPSSRLVILQPIANVEAVTGIVEPVPVIVHSKIYPFESVVS